MSSPSIRHWVLPSHYSYVRRVALRVAHVVGRNEGVKKSMQLGVNGQNQPMIPVFYRVVKGTIAVICIHLRCKVGLQAINRKVYQRNMRHDLKERLFAVAVQLTAVTHRKGPRTGIMEFDTEELRQAMQEIIPRALRAEEIVKKLPKLSRPQQVSWIHKYLIPLDHPIHVTSPLTGEQKTVIITYFHPDLQAERGGALKTEKHLVVFLNPSFPATKPAIFSTLVHELTHIFDGGLLPESKNPKTRSQRRQSKKPYFSKATEQMAFLQQILTEIRIFLIKERKNRPPEKLLHYLKKPKELLSYSPRWERLVKMETPEMEFSKGNKKFFRRLYKGLANLVEIELNKEEA